MFAPGIAGNQFEFDEKGDGPAFYLVKNYRHLGGTSKYEVVGEWSDEDLKIYDGKMFWPPYYKNELPLSRCSVDCSPGHRKASVAQACCWVCVPCAPNEFMKNGNNKMPFIQERLKVALFRSGVLINDG